ncbi:helix-turn-helix domain-containing protein [Caballeronia arvi]|uniref:helix-turn-helix domain-containing protein n=1 Tax=Caballeronia arvi TaxID=1777135 RepID=UPI003899607D
MVTATQLFEQFAGPPLNDEILTIPEVAALLRVAEKTVYTLAQRGEIPAFKVGGQWRFSRSAIQAWIDSHNRTPQGSDKPDASSTSSEGAPSAMKRAKTQRRHQ